jgi:hypothetical protein
VADERPAPTSAGGAGPVDLGLPSPPPCMIRNDRRDGATPRPCCHSSRRDDGTNEIVFTPFGRRRQQARVGSKSDLTPTR